MENRSRNGKAKLVDIRRAQSVKLLIDPALRSAILGQAGFENASSRIANDSGQGAAYGCESVDKVPRLPQQNLEGVPADAMRKPALHQADVHWYYSETIRYFEGLLSAVRCGQRLDEANNAARYFLFSRVTTIIAPYDSNGPLKVDSAHLRWLAEELRREVCARYSMLCTAAAVVPSQETPMGKDGALAAIDRKLEAIAGQLVKLSRGCGSQVQTLPEHAICSSTTEGTTAPGN